MAVGLDDVKRIHLIGVGGCSMSGIAQILQKQGHVVTGSDRERSQFTDRLEELGIPVSIPQKGEQVEGAELVIYSAAIKPDNPERAYAREHGIPEMERSVALGQISARYPHVAAISGCHGKTTITSMLAYINEEAKLDATVHVGGFVDLLGGGVKVGDGDLFITEACEYVRSFLTLVPTVALVNNIDNDHLDCYKDQQEIIETFAQFCALVPPEGEIIVCRDDEKVQRLLPLLDREPLTYGLSEGDWHAADVAFDSLGCASFDLVHEGNTLGRITLHVPGTHNVINAIAASSSAPGSTAWPRLSTGSGTPSAGSSSWARGTGSASSTTTATTPTRSPPRWRPPAGCPTRPSTASSSATATPGPGPCSART